MLKSKSEKHKRFFEKSLTGIFAVLILAVLGWMQAGEAHAYFNDTEGSTVEIGGGILDFNLSSPSDFAPAELSPSQSATRFINLENKGNLQFSLLAKAQNLSGDLCEKINLAVTIDSQPVYSGLLNDFDYDAGSLSDPEEWIFIANVNPADPESLNDMSCSFKFIFTGENGFSDTEEVDNYLTYSYSAPAPPPPPDSSYWNEDFETYAIGSLNANPKWGNGLTGSPVYNVVLNSYHGNQAVKAIINDATGAVVFTPGKDIYSGKVNFSIAVRPFHWSNFYTGSVIHFIFRNTEQEYLFGFDVRRYPSYQTDTTDEKFCVGRYNSGNCWDENFLISKESWAVVVLGADFENKEFTVNASSDGNSMQETTEDIMNTPAILHDLNVDIWYGMSADFDNITAEIE